MKSLQPSQLPGVTAAEAAPMVDAAPILVRAQLEHIYISPGHDYWVKRPEGAPPYGIEDVAEVRCVVGRGLKGDRYFNAKPGKAGQVTFLAAEMIESLRKHLALDDISPALFRRNLIVRGMDLPSLYKKRFVFQGITFEGAQECKPCVWMDRVVVEGAQAFMRSPFFGGLRARVWTTGILSVNA